MASLHAVSRAIQEHRGSYVTWDSVRSEIKTMRGLLPLLYRDLSRTSSGVVLAQDAAGPSTTSKHCPTGAFCIGAGVVPRDELQAILLRREARGELHIDHDGLSIAVAREQEVGHECDITTIIPTVHRTILLQAWFSDAAVWRMFLARRWKFPVHINLGESRALVAILSLYVALPSAYRTWVLDLSDNATTVAVMQRGRSQSWLLNRQARKRAALEGAYNFRVAVAWTDTTHMPMDGGTRPDSTGNLVLSTLRM